MTCINILIPLSLLPNVSVIDCCAVWEQRIREQGKCCRKRIDHSFSCSQPFRHWLHCKTTTAYAHINETIRLMIKYISVTMQACTMNDYPSAAVICLFSSFHIILSIWIRLSHSINTAAPEWHTHKYTQFNTSKWYLPCCFSVACTCCWHAFLPLLSLCFSLASSQVDLELLEPH